MAIAICGIVGYAEQGKPTIDQPNSNTIYTFEIAMNGANAAERYQMYNDFNVPMGQLTPQGMRQKYLLGKYNRYKSDSAYGYNSTYNDWSGSAYRDMKVTSTSRGKAIASAMAEMIGFTNGGEIHMDLMLTPR